MFFHSNEKSWQGPAAEGTVLITGKYRSSLLDKVRVTSFLGDSCQSPPCTDSHSSAKKIKIKMLMFPTLMPKTTWRTGLNKAMSPVFQYRGTASSISLYNYTGITGGTYRQTACRSVHQNNTKTGTGTRTRKSVIITGRILFDSLKLILVLFYMTC